MNENIQEIEEDLKMIGATILNNNPRLKWLIKRLKESGLDATFLIDVSLSVTDGVDKKVFTTNISYNEYDKKFLSGLGISWSGDNKGE